MGGLSTWLVVGRFRGFSVERDGPSLRIHLGWLSLCYMKGDLEILLQDLLSGIVTQEEGVASEQEQVGDLRKEVSAADERAERFRDAARENETVIAELRVEVREGAARDAELKQLRVDVAGHAEKAKQVADRIDRLENEVEILTDDNDELSERLQASDARLKEALRNDATALAYFGVSR